MGAHTEYGNYVIDYRKTRHYNMPDLSKVELTPFVTKEMESTKWEKMLPDGTTFEPPKVDGMDLLRTWKVESPSEYEWYLNFQAEQEQGQTFHQETSGQIHSHEINLAEEPTQIHSASGTKPKN